MKRFSCILVILTLVFALAGCSVERKITVEKGGTVKVKDNNGDEMKIGKAKWDKEKMFGLDAPKATIESYTSTANATIYTFSDLKDADAYIQKIKDSGFTYNYVSVDGLNYSGTNKDGFTIVFTYSKDSKSGSISAAKGEKPQEGGTIIEGDNATWDVSKAGGLPDPGVKITSFTSSGNEVTYTFEKLKDSKGYIEKIKQNGFTLEPTEVESLDGEIYSARNKSGDQIYFMSSSDGCSVVFTKAGN